MTEGLTERPRWRRESRGAADARCIKHLPERRKDAAIQSKCKSAPLAGFGAEPQNLPYFVKYLIALL